MRVDLESHSIRLGLVLDVFVNARRAEAVLQALERGPGLVRVRVPVLDLQMDRLVLLVVRALSLIHI